MKSEEKKQLRPTRGLAASIYYKMRNQKWFSFVLNRYTRLMSEEDTISEILLCIIEVESEGREMSAKTYHEICNRFRYRLRHSVGNWTTKNVEITKFEDWKINNIPDSELSPKERELRDISEFYHMSTFKETCEYYGLEQSHKLRKLFSESFPKGDNLKGKTKKVMVQENWDAKYILNNYPVSKATAYRAIKKGYFYVTQKKAREAKEKIFNAIDILAKLLRGPHGEEIKMSLTKSKSFSFYFYLDGRYCRLSNHLPGDWKTVPVNKWNSYDLSIDPSTWEDVKDKVESYY